MGSMRQKGVGGVRSIGWAIVATRVVFLPLSIPVCEMVPMIGYPGPAIWVRPWCRELERALGILVVSTLVPKNGAIPFNSSRCLQIDIICTTLYQPVLHCKVELRSVGLTRL